MKISQMLLREDFYTINENTLREYFISNNGNKTTLYVYPRLNAIVPCKPGKDVRDYLLCEYSIAGNKIKKLCAQAYVYICMLSHGLMSSKKCIVNDDVKTSTLIYPCNRKYRIFDFANRTVDVISKYGFDNTALQHEIEFRTRIDVPDFVPGLLSHENKGYKEKIINGRPLARISDGFDRYRDKAFELLTGYAAESRQKIPAKKYAEELQRKIKALLSEKAGNSNEVEAIINKLIDFIDINDEVITCFSHGDLQAGNIWVENNTDKIYIIDWESCGTRSTWYDFAALYQNLRPGRIIQYLSQSVPKAERAIVLLEDIIFQLNELNNLPESFGIEQFRQYCDDISQWLQKEGISEEQGD